VRLLQLLAVIGAVLVTAIKPTTWRWTVRNVLARQIYFTGIEALPIILVAGLAVGVAIVAQAGLWSVKVDRPDWFGSLVTLVIIQNLAPLLVNLLLISRSGSAIATELANMIIMNDVKVLESQGIDPFTYLVVPRVLGFTLSALCLTCLFTVTALVGGYLCGLLVITSEAVRYQPFVSAVLLSLQPTVLLSCLAKTLLPALAIAAICCLEGLRIAPVITAVPQASARAVVRSISALFILSALIVLLEQQW
jgi:phospholipid/cholesterol/gamma-HCH transport system permease protein